jgi:hypothetical protein
LATPGHIRALRAAGHGIAPVFAQQSIRENLRTGRTPQQVLDDAAWGVYLEGWRQPWGADADHLKTEADVEACAAAGYTLYTFDPGDHVDSRSEVPEEKYGAAIEHVGRLHRRLQSVAQVPFEVEVSVDETETPTILEQHRFIADRLMRLGVEFVSLAPRYVGRFEKGVDYIGSPEAFAEDFGAHAAVARELGPYKLSLHSGSDKFAVFDEAARATRRLVHLKTAGTSYLEALRTLAGIDPALFREIYGLARERYIQDRSAYHVSAELERTPAPGDVPDAELHGLLDQFDARQILHITFGSVLSQYGPRIKEILSGHASAYWEDLERHFSRHLAPFAG